MKELIKVIAFDADDTLWSNEPFFPGNRETIYRPIKPYGTLKIFQPLYFKQK